MEEKTVRIETSLINELLDDVNQKLEEIEKEDPEKANIVAEGVHIFLDGIRKLMDKIDIDALKEENDGSN